MLRVADKFEDSDVGRARTGNEDSYFVQSPLFVIADGMGGAQAGEVASELAIQAFRDGLPSGQIEDALAQTIQLANQRVYDLSVSEPQYQGMGTTCTVAYVDEREVVLAHVGDSRAYMMRDDDFVRISRDHSLVGELVDRGKVTEEEALVHPQRSVITRAVGPEPTVKVDTERFSARDGDVFLLCSDGLTDMVRETVLHEILAGADSLRSAGRALIAAANEAGGRDNITVLLFRLEEVDFADGAAPPTVEQEASSSSSGQATTAMAAVAPPKETSPTSSPPPHRTAPLPPDKHPPRTQTKKRSRLRRLLKPLLVVLILLGVVLYAGFVAMRGVFFVGLNSQRSVTIYRGLPYTLPFGVKLYTVNYTAGVRIDQIDAGRRDTFTDHKLRSLSDAEDLVRQLEKDQIK